jgi:CheY-like chemotaxis protein
MGSLDGIAVTAEIRSYEALHSLPRTPILILSDDPSKKKRKLALTAGANDFLVKPIERMKLARALYECKPA